MKQTKIRVISIKKLMFCFRLQSTTFKGRFPTGESGEQQAEMVSDQKTCSGLVQKGILLITILDFNSFILQQACILSVSHHKNNNKREPSKWKRNLFAV